MYVTEQAAKILRDAVASIRAGKVMMDMTSWIHSTHCGTTYCLAGTIGLMQSGDKMDHEGYILTEDGEGEHVSEFAAHLLDLSCREADALWYVRAWPGEFRVRYHTGDKLNALADRVEHFIETGE